MPPECPLCHQNHDSSKPCKASGLFAVEVAYVGGTRERYTELTKCPKVSPTEVIINTPQGSLYIQLRNVIWWALRVPDRN